ncbi:hypothetical protein FQR65_LT15051 [Abscondita terminalis]|nr:hypothetical protein FQR65_LT15051 [Abscondita terminalis]
MSSKRAFMTGEEKSFLKELVTKNTSIIESKKTDAVSVSEKKRGWIAIAQEFNAIGEHFNRTPEQLRKTWENMKSRRRKELAAEKINRMATGGGPYQPPSDGTDAIVDEVLNIVDIELKDIIDSDTVTCPAEENVDEVNIQVVQPKLIDVPNTGQSASGSHIAPTRSYRRPQKRYISRGTAIEQELEVRMERTKRLAEQDEEFHQLRMEEQLIKIEITKEILKQEKIKTEKLLK